MKTYKVAVIEDVKKIVFKEVRKREPEDRQVLVKVDSCAICTLEQRVYNGVMNRYPFAGGHEAAGTVEAIGKKVKGVQVGDKVAEYMMMDASDVYKMDPKIDLTHAALSEPLACCVHSIENGQIGLGDDVVVIGVGIMGALHIQLAKLKGARVIACELDDTRLEIAKKMGADILINSVKSDPDK